MPIVAGLVGALAVGLFLHRAEPAPHGPPAVEPVAFEAHPALPTAEPGSTSTVARAAAPTTLPMLGGPIDLEGRTVLQIIDAHSPAARRGDAVAAYRVYRVEALCSQAPMLHRSIDDMSDADRRREALADAEATDRACRGVTPAQMQERFVFLDVAVRSGNPRAILDFRTEGPNGQWTDVERLSDDPNVVQWRRRAIDELVRLGETGDVAAWATLSVDYESGLIVTKELRKALMYDLAVMIAIHPDTDPMTFPHIAKHVRALSATSVAAAFDDARRLVAIRTGAMPSDRRR